MYRVMQRIEAQRWSDTDLQSVLEQAEDSPVLQEAFPLPVADNPDVLIEELEKVQRGWLENPMYDPELDEDDDVEDAEWTD